MWLYMFLSGADPACWALTPDVEGRALPKNLRPWQAVGAVDTVGDNLEIPRISVSDIIAVIQRTGVYIGRGAAKFGGSC